MENTTQLSGDCWRATVKPHGTIAELGVLQEGSWRRIAFRDDTHAGPRWHGEWDGGEHQVEVQPDASGVRFESLYDGLRWSLAYQAHPSHLAIIASVRNERAETFRPARAGLRLGLDTYMPENDTDYRIVISVRSGSGLTGTVERLFAIAYEEPAIPILEAGFDHASLSASIAVSAGVDTLLPDTDSLALPAAQPPHRGAHGGDRRRRGCVAVGFALDRHARGRAPPAGRRRAGSRDVDGLDRVPQTAS